MTEEPSAVSSSSEETKPDEQQTPPAENNQAHTDTEAGTPAPPAEETAAPSTTTPANSEPTPAADEKTAEHPAPTARPNIQVGSRRRDASPKTAFSSKPMMKVPVMSLDDEPTSPDADGEESGEERDQAPSKVPTPSVRAPLPEDLEKAVVDAMSGVSVEDLMSGEATNQAAQEIELEARRQAAVVRIHGDNIFFSIGGRNEGVASIRQFKEPPNIGDQVEVVVKSFQADDGLYEVSIPGASVSVSDWSDLAEGAVVEARITGANTGGLECMVSQIRGFIPASQIGLFRVEDFAEYIGQKLNCVATEVNPRRRNLVLSHRAFLERERQEAREKLLQQLEPGSVVEGVVSSLRDFGAFVDIGGLDGLIHISQLSWERVNHPSDVLTVGQRLQVRVEKINPETGKIGLSYRNLLEHPWSNVDSEIAVGATIQGPVTRIAKFGAFVKLAPGVEGLIHISELAHRRVRSVSDVVSEGQDVEVKVLSVDSEAQRIGLSLKATQAEPEPEQSAEAAEDAGAETPVTAAQRSRPLKGGFDRPTGGESFGLKW